MLIMVRLLVEEGGDWQIMENKVKQLGWNQIMGFNKSQAKKFRLEWQKGEAFKCF